MKSTDPITYVYVFDAWEIAITRRHIGTAYARNGNVGNPTEYFRWDLVTEGEFKGSFSSRVEAYEYARGFGFCGNDGKTRGPRGRRSEVRYFRTVQDEMKVSYVRQEKEKVT